MHEVIVYTRAGCHLCEEAESVLIAQGLSPHAVDIDADPALVSKYHTAVPVVVIDGIERFRGRVDPILLRRLLLQSRPR